MALVKCINCNREYSDTMDSCPHCNFRPTLFKCPECGRFCSGKDTSCGYCGYPLTIENREAASLSDYEQLYNASVARLQGEGESIDYEDLEYQFLLLGNYKDSAEKASECHSHYAERIPIVRSVNRIQKEDRSKGVSRKTIGIIIAVVIGIVLIGVFISANTQDDYSRFDDSDDSYSDDYDDNYSDDYDDEDNDYDYDDNYDDDYDDDSYSTYDAPKDELLVDSDGKQIWYVYCTSGSISFDGTFEGSGNFIVEVSDDNQNLEELVCNEIGSYVLNRSVYVGTGYHYIEIYCSEGSWNMTWYGTGGA